MSATHTTVPTPSPKFRSLVVKASEDSFASSGGILPDEGTLYSDEAWKSFFGKDYHKNFAGFRYVGQGEGGTLIFVRSMTDDQRNTPFRTVTYTGNHPWHPVLFSLNLLRVPGSRVSGSAPSYVVREVYVPGVQEGTLFKVESFFSDIPYVIPRWPVPTPTAVNYDFGPGARGSFPECLHPEIKIKPLQIGTTVIVAGEASVTTSVVKGQLFPETNFTEWAPYVFSDKQEFSNGYSRTKVTVYPPATPEESIQ